MAGKENDFELNRDDNFSLRLSQPEYSLSHLDSETKQVGSAQYLGGR